MKKIIYGLLAALFLIGCQQPTIDYNNFSDIDPSRPEVELVEETVQDEQQEEVFEEEIVIEEDLTETEEDEHQIIVDTYRAYFEEYKADLKSRKESFEVEEDNFWYFEREDERDGTVIELLDWDLLNCIDMEKYHFKYGAEKTRKGYSNFTVAAAYAEYKEVIKKDLVEVEALWNEIKSLIAEVDNTLTEIELLTVEELIEKNNGVLTRISNLAEIDFQVLLDKYDATRVNKEIAQKYF